MGCSCGGFFGAFCGGFCGIGALAPFLVIGISPPIADGIAWICRHLAVPAVEHCNWFHFGANAYHGLGWGIDCSHFPFGVGIPIAFFYATVWKTSVWFPMGLFLSFYT